MKLDISTRHILVFDIECRPTAWFGGDYVGRCITGAAWIWLGEGNPRSAVLQRHHENTEPIMRPLMDAIESADVLVGHFIRGFDLPVISAELERLGWAPMDPVLTVDTKTDRKQTSGISESLENLVSRYELEHSKIPMSEPRWEEHNLWQTPRSVEWVRTRVEGDVISTMELYVTLLDEGRLKGPKVWSPEAAKMPRYRA